MELLCCLSELYFPLNQHLCAWQSICSGSRFEIVMLSLLSFRVTLQPRRSCCRLNSWTQTQVGRLNNSICIRSLWILQISQNLSRVFLKCISTSCTVTKYKWQFSHMFCICSSFDTCNRPRRASQQQGALRWQGSVTDSFALEKN